MAFNPVPLTLEQSGKAFLNLLDEAGNPDNNSFGKKIPALCARKCTKIVNRETVWEGRDGFEPQLLEARKKFGPWKLLEERGVHPSEVNNTVAVHYHAVPVKGPHLECEAILHYVKTPKGLNKIDNILEVFAEIPKCNCIPDLRDRA